MERRIANISDILIHEKIVQKKLNKLKEDKAMGSDEIHPKVLKECWTTSRPINQVVQSLIE